MPAQSAPADFLNKYGIVFDKSLQAHANDETRGGLQNFPPGVVNGVARVTGCKLDVYKEGPNKGDAYLQIRLMGVEPVSVVHNGQVCKFQGAQDNIMDPMCETRDKEGKVKRALDDNIQRALNDLRLVAGDDATRNLKSRQDLIRLVENINARANVKDRPLYVRLKTVAGKDRLTGKETDAVFINLLSRDDIDQYKAPKTANKVDDDRTGTAEAPVNRISGALPNGAPDAEDEPFDDGASVASTYAKAEARQDGPSADEIAELVLRASSKDKAAQNALEGMAVAAGFSEQQVNDADTWEDVADMIAKGRNPAAVADDEGEGEAAVEPEKGAMVKYRPPNKKGQPGKPVDCEVRAVQKKTRTCDLLNYDDQKTTYNKVSWDDIES